MAYTQARKSRTKGTRYVGYYLDVDGKPKVAGTFASDARFTMNCHCDHCKAYAAWYARERRGRAREASPHQRGRADVWRRDGSEFLSDDVWSRIWRAACDTAGLPQELTPYNARHTGISWAVEKRLDLGRIRQRAGHGSLEVTSRYQNSQELHQTGEKPQAA